jgi:uncharacterized membrane protein YdjX (TVP38/TMEM64 family)
MPENTAEPRKANRVFAILTVVGIILIALVVWLVDLKPLHDKAASLNGALVFLLMSLLPLVGVPVSFLYVVGGAKFGHVWGLVAAAVAIAIHLLGSWLIVHGWLRKPIESFVKKRNYRFPQIPEGEAIPICLLIALVPGAPYTVKNYGMVLGGAPFKQYFWTCLPAHFFHASLGILFGDFTGEMTKPKIIFLIIYAVVLAGLSHYVVHRLRARRKQDANSPQGQAA